MSNDYQIVELKGRRTGKHGDGFNRYESMNIDKVLNRVAKKLEGKKKKKRYIE